MKILIVEDEHLLAESIGALLENQGFEVEMAFAGETGMQYAELGVYDLLILDVMMPGLDGYEVARRVRARRLGVPILMLTAKSGLEDRIEGLNAGADNYLGKPVDVRELQACIHALLRRQGPQVDQMELGNTTLDLSSALLQCGSRRVRLSAKEFEVMRFLFQAGGRNCSKEAILAKAWGYDSDAVENHVEVYIGFLRKKLASIGSNVPCCPLSPSFLRRASPWTARWRSRSPSRGTLLSWAGRWRPCWTTPGSMPNPAAGCGCAWSGGAGAAAC